MSQSSQLKTQDEFELQSEYAGALEAEVHRQGCLPHLYGQHWYQWQWDFFTSTNKYNILSAANQVGKSSCQIRKCIHWATEPKLWPHLWPDSPRPTQFWYFYPDSDVSTTEAECKWLPEWLPRGEYKNHPQYGWELEYQKKKVYALRFKTGVVVFFKTYKQDPKKLQASTLYASFADEEMPAEYYDEINMRIIRHGFFHMVFTATIGQELWADVMDKKVLPNAFTRKVSMFDCLEYKDAPGVPTPWTKTKIEKEIIPSCKSELEVKRRVYGEVVVESGRVYESFCRERCVKAGHKLPRNWLVYSGVDIGSGGDSGHPAAIVFIAVNPDFTTGRVFRCWRGDKIRTTAGDILLKYRELKRGVTVVSQTYDHAAADFFTISCRVGEPFIPANKDRQRGIDLLNTLFMTGILAIHDDDPECQKLITELVNLKTTTRKENAKDDLIDALRFAATAIPWDYQALTGRPLPTVDPYEGMSERERNFHEFKKKMHEAPPQKNTFDIDAEFAEQNELYGEF